VRIDLQPNGGRRDHQPATALGGLDGVAAEADRAVPKLVPLSETIPVAWLVVAQMTLSWTL
jgi:hypothetical protein